MIASKNNHLVQEVYSTMNAIQKQTGCKATLKSCGLLLVLFFPAVAAADPFKVMSYNILADWLESSSMQWLGPNNPRRDRVGAVLNQENPDLIGLQEVTNSQLPDLIDYLPEYDYINNQGGFYNAIFYKRDRFQLQRVGSFELTSGAASRPVWAQLLDVTTNQSFVMLNVHLNPFDSDTRLIQTAEIQAKIPEIALDLPVILTGDFNFAQIKSSRLPETDHFLEISGRSGTQNRFFVDACEPLCGSTTTNSKKIDFILNTDDFQITDSQVVTTLIDGLKPSDHRPVTAVLSNNPNGSDRTRWATQSRLLLDMDLGSGLDGIGDFLFHSHNEPVDHVGVSVYYRDRFNVARLSDVKLDMKFTVPEPTESLPNIDRAVLRIYVTDVIGTLTNGLSLLHNVNENVYGTTKADFQTPYLDTGLDLVVPAEATGQYYEFDVTEFVMIDMLADESNPLAAFRIELSEGQQLATGEEAAYLIDTSQRAPQLVITFVPESATLILCLVGFTGASFVSRSRHVH